MKKSINNDNSINNTYKLMDTVKDVSLSLTMCCPYCGKEERIISLQLPGKQAVPVTHYCSCGNVYRHRMKINYDKLECLLLKFEVKKADDIQGKKYKDSFG